MEGAGLIGATVFGMALTNLHVPVMAQLRRVKEALVFPVVAVLFILMTEDLQRERADAPVILDCCTDADGVICCAAVRHPAFHHFVPT